MLTQSELVRYSRHIRLQEVGQAGQEKLKNTRILIIGMGGLGSPVALYLAAAGVGTLGLADFDTVEAHNLQRQILHDDAKINTPKLDSAITRLKALNPDLNYIPHPEGITQENAIELIGQYDLVIDGSDNFPTRYLVNDAAFFAKRPLVYGSIFQFEGQVSFFNTVNNGPCYRCLFPKIPEPGTVPNCEQAGVFGALCGTVGSLQAMEAIKHAMGIGESMQGRLMVIDSLSMSNRTLRLKKDPQCPLCGSNPSITAIEPSHYEFTCETQSVPSTENNAMEITIDDLASLNEPTFLDVREDFEVEICKIKDALHIPMGTIGERYESLPKDKPLVVYCHHGMRSLRVTEFLRGHGFDNAVSMIGGIDAWALQREPDMARY